METPLETLAVHASTLTYDDLDEGVIDSTKRSILDCVGVAIAGLSQDVSQAAMRHASEVGEGRGALLLGSSFASSPSLAAFANTLTARCLDFDDVYEQGALSHPTPTAVMSALSLASRFHMSGRDLIAIVAAGRDIIVRLALANRDTVGFHERVDDFNYHALAAAAVTGRLIGLSPADIAASMGLTFGHSMGSRQGLFEGTHALVHTAGMAALVGVQAAQLVRQGMTGPTGVIDGQYGLAKLVCGGKFDYSAIYDRLGYEHPATLSSFKPYPCGKPGHSAIYATASLVSEHGISPENIAGILVSTDRKTIDVWCGSDERRRNPKTITDAQFGIPWQVATAAVHGGFGVAALTDAGLMDARVHRTVERVQWRVDEGIEARYELGRCEVVVSIELISGEVYRRRVVDPPGSPGAPMSDADLLAKFQQCVASVAGFDSDRLVGLLGRLEEVEDVRPLTSLLAGP